VGHYIRTGDLLPPPSLEERRAAAMTHLCDLARTLGEDRAVRHLRGQLPHYIKGCAGASRAREEIVRATTIAEVARILCSVEEIPSSSEPRL
jgi:tRNA-dihydrouridine synthase